MQACAQPDAVWYLAYLQADALLYNAVAEIGVGFVTLLGLLFPPRHILTPFLVFNFLRMRYWSPDSSPFHRQVSAAPSPS